MMVQKIVTAVVLTTLAAAPGLAHAACSQQDVMAKGGQLSQLLQAKMAKDPTQGQALMVKMQPVMQSYQAQMTAGGSVDWDKVCGEYDELIKQAQ
jgi:hypothetical protein